MMKLAVSVVDLDASSKGFAELHLGTGEAEAFWLGRDLETAAVPLHDVVIADDALVDEAADAAEIFGGRAPSLFRFSGSAAEAAGVVRPGTAPGSGWCGRICGRPARAGPWETGLSKEPPNAHTWP